ncbi:MAG TPA: LicD family protein [Candidatus Stackebrandtia excrementipullorum]|nr:LicD family protein [Candidatus Stackebrandtia excrementipullorum]
MPSAKQSVTKVLSSAPVYRAMPRGAMRTYAALKYLGENASGHEITQFIRKSGGIPTRHLSTALIAARAVFRAGADDLLAETLDELQNRFPESPDLHALRADVLAYHGDYEAALEQARSGRMLQPSNAGCAARVVTYGYRVLSQADADEAALQALKRLPFNGEVMWAVTKLCETPEQYHRINTAWHECQNEPADLFKSVRQLATAAGRAGEVDAAVDLYAKAIRLVLDGGDMGGPIVDFKLEGKGAWTAFEDLHKALDGAGVPYFIAAGTALGLIREGRPLSADNDIDVGVFDEHFDRDALIELFAKNPMFDFDVVHPRTKKVGLKHRGGSPIDIFRFYPDGDLMYHDAVFVRWGNRPFEIERRDIRGLDLPFPADSDTYLTENYGDWRTPYAGFDAFFDGDAPNVEVTWADYLRLHFIRRGYKALSRGNRKAAAVEIERAGETELAHRMGASA